jgi:predicted GNAT family N-acyltransferase
MRLRLASSSEFDRLRKFRQEIFVVELGVQESTYQDVFNDYFSKNIVLEHGDQLAGVARLAFSREAQEFCFSYVALASEFRGHAIPRLLLGGLFTLMKANGVYVVRADSADQNLPMYLSAGCQVAGPRYKKYGFVCGWTPVIYALGTNPKAETRLMRKAQACLPRGRIRQWIFPIKLVACASRKDYQDAFCYLAASGQIMGVMPHFTNNRTATSVVLSDRLPPAQVVAVNSVKKACESVHFVDLNRCFDSDHRIVVTHDSPFREIAQTYACLTRKSLELIGEDALLSGELVPAKSRLFLLTRQELPLLLQSSFFQSQNHQLGVVTGEDEEEVSCVVLRNYFEFTAPVGGARPFPVTILRTESLAAASKWTNSHAVICHPNTPEEAIVFFRCLLHSGYTAGQAVRFTNLSFADALPRSMLLAGDPCLRYTPFRPHSTFGTDALPPRTQFVTAADGSVADLRAQADSRQAERLRRPPQKSISVKVSDRRHPVCSAPEDGVLWASSSKPPVD